MLLDGDIRGNDLPQKTLCLTYDDGPGPHTTQIGRFLFDYGIRAAFFVIGRHAEQHPDTLRHLRDWGHRIGNHTYSHAGLFDLAQAGGDVVGEVARADTLIREFNSGDVLYLRPPYGSWRRKTRSEGPEDWPTSLVADILNRSGRFAHYLGPIKWDTHAEDWHCWERGIAPAECARRYLQAIEKVGRGIVLMHDSAAEEDMCPRNQTLRLTQLLVPVLLARGYHFIGLDELPQVRRLRAGGAAQ